MWTHKWTLALRTLNPKAGGAQQGCSTQTQVLSLKVSEYKIIINKRLKYTEKCLSWSLYTIKWNTWKSKINRKTVVSINYQVKGEGVSSSHSTAEAGTENRWITTTECQTRQQRTWTVKRKMAEQLALQSSTISMAIICHPLKPGCTRAESYLP